MFSTSEWVAIVGVATTIFVAIASGLWAVFRWRSDGPFRGQRRKAYETLFEHICLATVPRLTSYDWRVLEHEIFPRKEEAEKSIRQSEGLDLRYFDGLRWNTAEDLRRANIAWVKSRCETGEQLISSKRLYVAKEHRDLFRNYLEIALDYANFPDDEKLSELKDARRRLESVVSRILRG